MTIHECLDELFPDILSEADKQALIQEAIRLINLLGSRITTKINQFENFYSALEQQQIHGRSCSTLQAVYETLVKKKVLVTNYFCSFLACDLQCVDISKHEFEQLKAITLLCCCQLMILGNHKSTIIAACVELRMIAIGRRNHLIRYLPASQPCLLQLCNQITAQAEYLKDKSLSVNICNQLLNIRLPIIKVLENRKAITRKVSPREFREGSILRTTKATNIDEGSSGITQIREVNIAPKNQNGWQDEESNTDQNRVIEIVSIEHTPKGSYINQALQARAISDKYLKRGMYLACDIHLSSEHEIKTLAQELFKASQSTQTAIVATSLLLMLLTGSNFEAVKKIRLKRITKSLYSIKRFYKLPTQKLPTPIMRYLSMVENNFELPLPIFMDADLIKQIAQLAEADLKNFISSLNKTKGTHLTLSKIVNAIHFIFKRMNEDPIYPALISQQTTSECAQLSYSQITQKNILTKYLSFTKWLARISEVSEYGTFDYRLEMHLDQMRSKIGTPMGSIQETIKLFIKLLDAQICSPKNTPEQLHNLLTIKTQAILAMSSGYRPVTGWLGQITDLDLDTSQFWVSDKENQLGDSSRVILLPKTSIHAIEKYIDFVKVAKSEQLHSISQLRTRYSHCLTGKSHLFFYIKENQILESTPKNIELMFRNILPLPLNWHRHLIRSYLSNAGVNTELLDAWMGHSKYGDRPYAKFSALNMIQLEEISLQLENFFKELKIRNFDFGKLYRNSCTKES
ncbi:hypothetical protein JQC92_08240 [Shewanella sp. 202IG2-18]|uniref:hypothetical protein n=1 Tax=Parashewanella hymeniacidonis TaxID=2807618 RepID=UPI00196011F7|nr:hypothetical protein [Parashewanella hymeniacidonis]MBM7072017.1 hypothetical protein [Parashewanella hymeniacidonis]